MNRSHLKEDQRHPEHLLKILLLIDFKNLDEKFKL